jgi:lysophospholipase L1-like esterase
MRPLPRLLAIALVGVSCGGGSGPGNPTVVSTPPPSVPTFPVSGFVFYDANGNGVRDAGEDGTVPGVIVRFGSAFGQSAAEGRFTVAGVPEGPRTAAVDTASLPPFFTAPAVPALPVPPPAGFDLAVPAGPPIGGNRPYTFMAFGDSITQGDGSRRRDGYRRVLQDRLTSYWGVRADVIDQGVSATRSDDGAGRIDAALRGERPAYTLVLYGTNDWNVFACRSVDTCFTRGNIVAMIRSIRAAGGLPVVGTIPPVNPAFTDRSAADRNAWIEGTNAVLRPLIRAEGGVVADVHAAMLREAGGESGLPALFSDHIHPNDRGYDAVADAFFRAIVTPTAAAQP